MMSMAVLVLGLMLSAPTAQDARTEAERLAKSGAREEALKRFQALAAADPSDISARLWIARLHLEMDHPQRAAAVYESIAVTQPQNVDALVGLGVALTRTGRFNDASDALSRAESLAADRMDVLSSQGALHAAAGRSTLALAYYGRALALDPANEAARQAADAIRAARAHRIELDYHFQTFKTFARDTNTGTVAANFRLTDAVRVFARAQVHEGTGDTETRAGAGLEWMAHPNLWLRGGVLAGADTFELPALDTFADLMYRSGKVTWTFEGRFVDFDGADLLIAGPRLAVRMSPAVTTFAAYHRGRTSFEFADSSTSDNVTLGVAGSVGSRTQMFVEYRHGIDRLDWLTIDRLDAGGADTLSLGAMTDLTPFFTVGAEYDYQARQLDERVQRARARLIFRF
jgi:tetratricopeptide (TPR) repeat protein